MHSLGRYILEKGTLKSYSASLSRIHIYVLDQSIPNNTALTTPILRPAAS